MTMRLLELFQQYLKKYNIDNIVETVVNNISRLMAIKIAHVMLVESYVNEHIEKNTLPLDPEIMYVTNVTVLDNLNVRIETRDIQYIAEIDVTRLENIAREYGLSHFNPETFSVCASVSVFYEYLTQLYEEKRNITVPDMVITKVPLRDIGIEQMKAYSVNRFNMCKYIEKCITETLLKEHHDTTINIIIKYIHEKFNIQ